MSSAPRWFDAVTDPDLNPLERLCLAVLVRYQGSNASAWPSRARLAADLGVTQRTVRRLIVGLESKGKITVSHPDRQGRSQPVEYAICVPEKGDAPDTLFETKGCRQCPEKGDASVRPYIRKNMSVKKSLRTREKKPLVPPTAKEVREYASTLGNPIFPAEGFIEYYEALGWRDKHDKPVQNWKGRVRTWHERENKRRIAKGWPPLDGYSQYGTHKASAAEIETLQAEGLL